MSWYAGPLASLDFETTGVDPHHDRVVSVAALGPVGVGDDLVGLVNPGVPIPEKAAEVHGIRDGDVVGAPASDAAIRAVVAWVSRMIEAGAGVVVYNAPYDLTMLRAEARRAGIAEPQWERLGVIDPLVIDWKIDQYRKGKRTLSATAEHYGVVLSDAHDARADAVAAREIALALGPVNDDVAGLDLAGVTAAQRDWYRVKVESWNNWARGKGLDHRVDDPEAWPFA